MFELTSVSFGIRLDLIAEGIALLRSGSLAESLWHGCLMALRSFEDFLDFVDILGHRAFT